MRISRTAVLAALLLSAGSIVTVALSFGAQPRTSDATLPQEPVAASRVEPPALTITAPPELQSVAAQMERLNPRRLVPVMQLVGVRSPGPPITVVLAAEGSALAQQTPPWIAGYADSRAASIVIFPSRAPSYPHHSLESLLHHEVAHVLIGRAAGHGDVPRWFHEGVALAAERGWGLEDRTRLAMAAVGPRRSLDALDADFHGGPAQASRAYAISGALVRDVLRRDGADAPARILARLAGGDRFATAFREVTGRSLEDAERVFWRDSWWYHVVPFITSSLMIWVGIILLGIWAMRRRAARRAALRRRWEDEERAEQEATFRVSQSGESPPAV